MREISDYIKREDALDSLRDGMCGTGYQGMAMDCLNEIYVPSADVAPVRHGLWSETVTDGFLFVSYSACGFKTGRIDYNYCPNCGAKMDGADE